MGIKPDYQTVGFSKRMEGPITIDHDLIYVIYYNITLGDTPEIYVLHESLVAALVKNQGQHLPHLVAAISRSNNETPENERMSTEKVAF